MESLLLKDARVVPMTAQVGERESFRASVGVVGQRIVLLTGRPMPCRAFWPSIPIAV